MIARKCADFFRFIIVFAVCITARNCAKLNVPRLLLPYNVDKPTSVLLEITDVSPGDCFKWLSAEPYHVAVSPLYNPPGNNCSRKAVVSTVSTLSQRHVSYILAIKKDSPENSLSCEVITDSIRSITLIYSTTTLLLDSPPEMITVSGQNAEGVTFSSLNGMEFQWSFSSFDSSSSMEDIIRFSTFSDASYKSPCGILDWEKQGLKSSSVLIEGLHIGSARIVAKLKNPVYSDVSPAEVSLKVVSNVRLNPSHSLYLLPGSSVPYKLEAIRQGRAIEIPHEDYSVKVKNVEIAHVDEKGSVVALKSGTTTAFTEDIYDKSVLSSAVQVVEPSYMLLDVSPGSSWALEEVKNYEISVKIYDANHHQLYLTPNVRVRISFPSRIFYINATSPNGTYHVVRTVVPGSGTIRAELRGVEKKDGTLMKFPSITASQKVVIYQSIQIMPPFIMVPWDEVSKQEYVVNLKASGGTGVYVWSSSNASIADVKYEPEESSQAFVYVQGGGDVLITAVDRHNPVFSAKMKLSSQPIAEIEINPTVVEASLGNHIYIPVGLLGYEDKEKKIFRVFDDCSKINLSVEVVDSHRIEYMPHADVPPFGRGCASLQFLCKSPGHSRVHVKYGAGEDNSIKTTLVLACHKLIKPVNPVRVAVLALGTVKEVVFEGGPRPWPMYKKGHYSKLTAEQSELVDISEIKDPIRYNKDLHVFKVLCKKLGETLVKIRVGNQESATNRNPAKMESSVKIVCGEPATIHLAVQSKSGKGEKDKNRSGSTIVKVPFYGSKLFEVNLWMKDSIGRKFANISSFSIYWKVSDYGLAKPRSFRDFITYSDGSKGYQKVSRNFQEFEMTGNTGSLKVTANLDGYCKDMLEKLNITDYVQLNAISESIDVQLISMRDNYDNPLNQGNKEANEGTCDGDTCHS